MVKPRLGATRFLLALIVAVTLVLLPAVEAERAQALNWGSDKQFRSWTGSTKVSRYGNGCTVSTQQYMQEFGKSRVNRFKVRWELRGAYDSGHWFIPTHQTRGYYYSPQFFNDAQNYWWSPVLPRGAMNFPAGKTYGLWVKVVGVRVGRPDFVRHYKVQNVRCERPEEDWSGGGGFSMNDASA